jgi:hypothetical protein
VAIVRIYLDSAPYDQIDATMERFGYHRKVPGTRDGEEVWFALPIGTYWTDRDMTAEAMRDEAVLALHAADELGGRVVVTVGESAWHGLELTDAPVKADEVESKG